MYRHPCSRLNLRCRAPAASTASSNSSKDLRCHWSDYMSDHLRSPPSSVAKVFGSTHMAGPLPFDAGRDHVMSSLMEVRAGVSRLEEMMAERHRVRDYYSTAEVAEILGKAEFTVREWCRHGRVRAEKKNNGRGKYLAWVISADELKRIQKEGLLPA